MTQFSRSHGPGQAAGILDRLWDMSNIVNLVDALEVRPGKL